MNSNIVTWQNYSEDEAREAAAAEVSALPDDLDLIKPAGNSEYINKIRKRLNEDEAARQEREKRRRKVLVDQLRAHEAQEVSDVYLIRLKLLFHIEAVLATRPLTVQVL